MSIASQRIRPVLILSMLLWSGHFGLSNADDLSRDYGKLFTDGLTSPRWIALTFDDGPSTSTPEVLDLLKKYDVKATFFMMGSRVTQYPEFARRVLQEGHMIGNHSYT